MVPIDDFSVVFTQLKRVASHALGRHDTGKNKALESRVVTKFLNRFQSVAAFSRVSVYFTLIFGEKRES
jgi:hypothetical protein